VAGAGQGEQVAASDQDGRFRIQGLEPGTHTLAVHAENWRVVRCMRPAAREDVGTDGRVRVHTGEVLEVVVAPVRLFRVRLVRRAMNTPVASTLVTLRVRPMGHEAVTQLSAHGLDAAVHTDHPDRSPLELLSREGPPGLVVGLVDLDAHGTVPETAELVVEAEGYRPRRAVIKLRTASAVAAGVAADVVELTPEHEHEGGTLLVDCTRTLAGISRPGLRFLSVCRLDDGLEVHLRGTLVEEDVWQFVGVPAGTLRFRVFDGVSASDPAGMELQRGEERRVTVHFADPTGVAMLLVDARGRRLFDADTVLFLREDQTRGATNVAPITRFRPGARGPLHVVHPLRPGAWRFLVYKRGHGMARGTFHVSANQVRHIRAILKDVPR
jgi:hypothetical protein